MFVKFLKSYRSSFFSRHESALSDFDIRFNPSFQVSEGKRYFAVRAKRRFEDRGIEAYIVTEENRDELKIVNLSAHCLGFEIPKVADPKLFLLGTDVWCTFNTGHVASGSSNSLFVIKIEPILGKPFLVSFDSRTRIEKNWAFFKCNDDLFALYGLENVKILKCRDHSGGDQWVFDLHMDLKQFSFPRYTIGTQLVQHRNSLFFVAHRKIHFRRKRLYLGKVFKLNKDDWTVTSRSPFLAHSLRSLFGEKVKFNKNLISCTYFSGMCQQGNIVYLGYGINDVNFSICEINCDELWK